MDEDSVLVSTVASRALMLVSVSSMAMDWPKAGMDDRDMRFDTHRVN